MIGEYLATPPTLTDRQQQKLRLTTDGSLVVSSGNSASTPSFTTSAKAATATTTSVTAAAADTSVLAANTNRLPGSTIANDSTAIMYVLFGSGAASTTNYTAAIDGKTTVPGVLTLPDGYVGAARAYWASATGSARVTELSA